MILHVSRPTLINDTPRVLPPYHYPTCPLPAAASARRYAQVRAHSLALAAPLSAEDQCIQSMPDASPTKWHLAHTSWFFEAVVLRAHAAGYQPFDEHYFYLFNSYYESLGPRHPRPQRGLLSRPSVDEVRAYRTHVDAAMQHFMEQGPDEAWAQALPLITLGLNHEQQHQELLLTDILHALSCNPLLPAYRTTEAPALRLAAAAPPQRWIDIPGGVVPGRAWQRGLCIRQRNAAPQRAAGALPGGRQAGELR